MDCACVRLNACPSLLTPSFFGCCCLAYRLLTDLAAEEHPVRRLAAAANYRPDVGTMDTELASAAAITKAVNKPSMGSAKFATHVGISEGKVASGARKHGGWVALDVLFGTKVA